MLDCVLLACVQTKLCKKIQLFPELVCKKHEEMTSHITKGTAINERAMSKFDRGTNKIWPKEDPDISGPKSLLDRQAFMVVYEATDSKKCVRCLVLHTEVFFSFGIEGGRCGYIWMYPNFANLLRSCLSENLCKELWYDKSFEKLAISDYMRPWSIVDIGDSSE